MAYRTSAPSGPRTRYRITAPLPLIVVFPSVAYTVQLQSCPPSGRHELVAHDATRAAWPVIGPTYRTPEQLRDAVSSNRAAHSRRMHRSTRPS